MTASFRIALLLALCAVTGNAQPGGRVVLGIETLAADSSGIIAGKRIGVVCNHTSLFPNGVHLADSLMHTKGVALAAIFTPEHGFRGDASAGEKIESTTAKGIPVYSLYGKSRKPTKEMLKGIDILVFDMQDAGARFYTYISTMGLCIEAAAESGIPIVICDRPNPLRGDIVQGPVLRKKYKSFAGMYPIPIRHGMTVCELARMAAGKRWLRCAGVRLHCIPMQGWKRSMWYDETGLPWVAPSPNIPDLETAILYPGMCLIEGTNLSEGRGTAAPFRTAGAPFLEGTPFYEMLAGFRLEGAAYESVAFTPVANPGAIAPKHENRKCAGVRFSVVHRDQLNPIFTGLSVIAAASSAAPDSVKLKPYLAQLAGTQVSAAGNLTRKRILQLSAAWAKESNKFRQTRSPYLLYK